ncbi:MAG: acetylglutamate kinase [Treponema sp.]|jgi:acetylglutamate kinase|nr:acetylglutamate kinase [Treponema sp.]
MSSAGEAEILVQALPYIRKYRGRTIVVKYGGASMINEGLKAQVIQDIVLMNYVGIRVILVHGGGPEIEVLLKRLGKESRFVQGLRYTDGETMEVVQMVLCGKLNKEITALIENAGGRAVGLCGIDGATLKARRLKAAGGEDLGLVGEIEDVDTTLLNALLDSGIIPVLSSVAFGLGEDAGRSLNVNADTAAAKLAAAVKAEKLLLMTDVKGILRDMADPGSLIQAATLAELESLKEQGVVSKGMIPKVDCCALALSGGVKKAHIIDGREPHSLIVELFTDRGVGTMVSPA